MNSKLRSGTDGDAVSLNSAQIRMRFLILTQYFPPEVGAPQTRLRAFTSELRQRGHSVEVVTSMPNYPLGRIFPSYGGAFYRREVHEGVVIHRVWAYASMGHGLRRIMNYLSFTLLSLLGLLQCEKPDYLFVESPPLLLMLPATLCAHLRNIPLILNVADLSPRTEISHGFLRSRFLVKLMYALEEWSYKNAYLINAITEGVREYLLVEKGIPAEKILFLPNGVDTHLFQPRLADHALKEQVGLANKRVILYPGTLGYPHGLDIVLDAAQLLERQPEIHFLFLGHGSEKPRLEERAKSMGLRNVSFLDPVPPERLSSFFSIADCGLASLRDLPIYRGARPAKVFPILAAAKPLILVGRGEAARLLEQARAGVVVPPDDPNLLAETVSRLLESPELRSELGRNGREFVEANLQWSKLIGDWMVQLDQARKRNSALPALTQL